MSFKLGLYDIFANAIPGAAYIAVLLYIATRLQWLAIDDLTDVNTTVALLAGLVLSYTVGQITYVVQRWVSRLLPGYGRSSELAQQVFLDRCPSAQNEAFLYADHFLLLSGIEVHDLELASEVTRLRAAAIMQRSLVLPFALAAAISTIEIFTGSPAKAAVGIALFALASVGAFTAGRERGRWARQKTLEIAFWIPDMEEKLQSLQSRVDNSGSEKSTCGRTEATTADPE